MPSATTSGASFCAIPRGFDTRTFTAFDFELFICKLLFIPIDTTSRRQRTNYQLKALTATPTATTSLDDTVPHFPLPHGIALAGTLPHRTNRPHPQPRPP